MRYQAWHLEAMEDYGYTDTSGGLVNRVAHNLAKSPNDEISRDEFRRACVACGVDPNSFTSGDYEKLRRKLEQIT